MSQVLLKCNGLLKEFGDEFVSLEHFLLALVSANDETANMLKKLGVTEAKLKTVIKEHRKGATVNSSNAESTFNSLEKYAKNLNKLAASGKLDPVIGRDEEIRRPKIILSL